MHAGNRFVIYVLPRSGPFLSGTALILGTIIARFGWDRLVGLRQIASLADR